MRAYNLPYSQCVPMPDGKCMHVPWRGGELRSSTWQGRESVPVRHQLWDLLVHLMKEVHMEVPSTWQELTGMLITSMRPRSYFSAVLVEAK